MLPTRTQTSFPPYGRAMRVPVVSARINAEQPSQQRLAALAQTDLSTAVRSDHRQVTVTLVALATMWVVTLAVDARAQGSPSAGRETIAAIGVDGYGGAIAEAAQRFELPAQWIRVVMQAESAGVASATSPVGAMGLMQVMPDTYAAMQRRYGLGSNPYDPRDNVLAGAAFIRELFDRYGAPGFVAAYNAGPARYERYLREGRPLPAETVALVAALTPTIGGTLPESQAPASFDTAPSPEEAPIFVGRGASASTDNPGPASDPSDANGPTLFAARRLADRQSARGMDDERQSTGSSPTGRSVAAGREAPTPDARLFVAGAGQRERP